jgi:hypothetical protein
MSRHVKTPVTGVILNQSEQFQQLYVSQQHIKSNKGWRGKIQQLFYQRQQAYYHFSSLIQPYSGET